MDPLDHVVANIHGIDVFGKLSHLKRVDITRGLESGIPPTRPFDQRLLNLWGSARIDVVDNRLLRD